MVHCHQKVEEFAFGKKSINVNTYKKYESNKNTKTSVFQSTNLSNQRTLQKKSGTGAKSSKPHVRRCNQIQLIQADNMSEQQSENINNMNLSFLYEIIKFVWKFVDLFLPNLFILGNKS